MGHISFLLYIFTPTRCCGRVLVFFQQRGLQRVLEWRRVCLLSLAATAFCKQTLFLYSDEGETKRRTAYYKWDQYTLKTRCHSDNTYIP